MSSSAALPRKSEDAEAITANEKRSFILGWSNSPAVLLLLRQLMSSDDAPVKTLRKLFYRIYDNGSRSPET